MPCKNLVIWRPIPANSIFRLAAHGPDDHFNITVAMDCDTGEEPPWRHEEILAGSKERRMNQNDSCTLTAFISVLSITGDPLRLTAWLTSPNGDKIKHCEWSFHDPGTFQIMINVDTR